MLEGKRIFIVEDDPVNMAVMAVSLKTAGAQIIQDAWNTDTINRLRGILPVDVILLDLMLRYGNSGYDIFEEIKQFPELASIPVIVVSASDPEMEMKKARKMGFAGYIPKPIRRHSFVESIQEILDGNEVWASH